MTASRGGALFASIAPMSQLSLKRSSRYLRHCRRDCSRVTCWGLLSQTFAVNERAASQGQLSQDALAVNSQEHVKNNSC